MIHFRVVVAGKQLCHGVFTNGVLVLPNHCTFPGASTGITYQSIEDETFSSFEGEIPAEVRLKDRDIAIARVACQVKAFDLTTLIGPEPETGQQLFLASIRDGSQEVRLVPTRAVRVLDLDEYAYPHHDGALAFAGSLRVVLLDCRARPGMSGAAILNGDLQLVSTLHGTAANHGNRAFGLLGSPKLEPIR